MLAEFTPELRDQFLALLFSREQIARRSEDPWLCRNGGLISAHLSRQNPEYLHGSEMVERIYVAVRFLERLGSHNRLACYKLASLLRGSLSKSKRGRPSSSANPHETEFTRKVETVRSLVNAFAKKQHPWRDLLPERDLILEDYVGRFLWLTEGIRAIEAYSATESLP
jgi:hypothetical protein